MAALLTSAVEGCSLCAKRPVKTPLGSDIGAAKLPATGVGSEELSQEAKQRELDALLRSRIVRERTCLHSLLCYLGKKAIEDGAEPLKEYTIGIEALGKPEDYDPRLDPTVRVDIGKLRTKLRDYYQGPGSTSSVRAEIPKGQYHLVFVRARSVSPAHPPERQFWRRPSAMVAAGFLAATILFEVVHP